jgi:hypothetical protein
MDSATIAPCPFCGGSAKLLCNGPTREQIEYCIAWAQDYDVSYYCECVTQDCCATGPERPEQSDAIAAWNQRKPLAVVRVERVPFKFSANSCDGA